MIINGDVMTILPDPFYMILKEQEYKGGIIGLIAVIISIIMSPT
jgi:hypothetical protein